MEKTLDEKIVEMLSLLREVNAAWADMPRNYKLWIDWDSRPVKVVLVEGMRVERNVVGP